LDCWRYWEHRLFHEVPLLWRAHLVHHSDTAMDVTTAERHHPLERLVTTLLAFVLVFALGFSAQALGLYLLVAMLSALYTHANIALPEAVDGRLRRWLVTPAVHAVHHSSYQPETDSNYGSVLTVWDRLFGTYLDPSSAQIPRFGLESFRRDQDTELAPALLQPFRYRPNGTAAEMHPRTHSGNDRPGPPLSSEWRQALRIGGIGLALALIAMWPTVLNLAHVWSVSESYQYGWLVLPTFVYVLGWHYRDDILAMTPHPGYTGLPVILLAAALWMTALAVDIKLVEHIALVLALQGIALCSVGWSAYRRLLPVMLLLFLMIPCGDILQPLLRDLTVKWIQWFAEITGIPHSIEGYIVHLGSHRYVVIDACSGLTFFTLAGFLGYSFGLLLFRSLPKVLALAVLGAVLGILTNAVRVCLIVGIDWLRGSQMDLTTHGDIQWLVLLASLGLLLFLAVRLSHDDRSEPVKNVIASPPQNNLARYGAVLAGALMLASLGLAQVFIYRSDRPSAANMETLQKLAERYPGSRWLGEDQAESHSLSVPISDSLEVVVIAPAKGASRLDESSLRPEDENIWRHANTERYRECVKSECITFVHTSWDRKGTNETRHTFYSYFVGELTTDSNFTYRLVSGWNRMAGTTMNTGLIGFKLSGDVPGDLLLGNIFRSFQS
jgi:exosortase